MGTAIVTESAVSDWQKGGARYAKLTEVVSDVLGPAPVLTFIVAVRHQGGQKSWRSSSAITSGSNFHRSPCSLPIDRDRSATECATGLTNRRQPRAAVALAG